MVGMFVGCGCVAETRKNVLFLRRKTYGGQFFVPTRRPLGVKLLMCPLQFSYVFAIFIRVCNFNISSYCSYVDVCNSHLCLQFSYLFIGPGCSRNFGHKGAKVFFSIFVLFLQQPLRYVSLNLRTFRKREREKKKFEKGGKQKDTAHETHLVGLTQE